MNHRITLIQVRRPTSTDLNQELQWIGNSLGLFGLRDKDSSCFRIFITLIRRSRRTDPLSSDEIASSCDLSRATVIHHLEKLVGAGIVIKEKEGYLLRENNMERVIKNMQRDMNNLFAELEEVAKQIDQKLG